MSGRDWSKAEKRELLRLRKQAEELSLNSWRHSPPSAKQLDYLDDLSRDLRGEPFMCPKGFTRGQASDLIDRLIREQRKQRA